ncbi:glycosyltransferase family 2 protein [Paraglaciecola hydrolytica]|uniref:Glycosyltransferase 2-like domain-containing protein n=1 Tax=Paraglaciecola hydrolytica TaxID=1799789 RepID=A0A136A3K1_9ALTE|nr:glycosyltransferase family 2 protein [Paraglaciecola hydrolytica]KXI29802.1 hypothetical protein AX660_07155 [Paraglaciecola hydrolytica]
MELSIVIVNYKSWDDLGECLSSIAYLLSEQSRIKTEVIVVDNQSNDDKFDSFVTQFPQVQFVLNQGNFGFAHACNTGAALAKGQEFLFLNPDTKDPAQQIEKFWQLKQQYKVNLMTIKQDDGHGKIKKVFDIFPTALNSLGPIRAILRLLNPSKYSNARYCNDSFRDVDWVSGAALMITASDFKKLQGFSEQFWMYSEDVDLCFRANNNGMRVGFSADACIEHRHGGSSRINLATTALTKSEVVISKHVYATKNFRLLHAFVYHLFLLIFRFMPCILFKLISMLMPKSPKAIKIGALRFSILIQFYRNGLCGKGWQSVRTVGFKQ